MGKVTVLKISIPKGIVSNCTKAKEAERNGTFSLAPDRGAGKDGTVTPDAASRARIRVYKSTSASL